MSELLKRPETMVDVSRLLPEGTPIQVINNEFYMTPAPDFLHFNTVDSIVDELKKVVLTGQPSEKGKLKSNVLQMEISFKMFC